MDAYATSTPHPSPAAVRASGFPWEVYLSDGRAIGFETRRDAERFCRENPAPKGEAAR